MSLLVRISDQARHRLACIASGARKTFKPRYIILYKKQTKKVKRTTKV